MILNGYGLIVRDEWLKSAEIRDEIVLDDFVIMPNHVHGIIRIVTGDTAIRRGDRPVAPTIGLTPKSLGALIAGFKSASTSRINILHNTPGTRIWQRNYYEHVIRHDDDLNKIREYITGNPGTWESDRENPEASAPISSEW